MSTNSFGESGLIEAAARSLVRSRPVASLATLEIGTGCPYASLVTVATETGGSPVILISKLAWHTRNLEADPRASILFCADAASGDPLNLGRVSVMGVAEPTADPRTRQRFLARHPRASFYADFADFGFWRLRVERAHYVGGFGRITTLSAAQLFPDADAAPAWDAEIDASIAAANEAQAGLIASLASAAAPNGVGEGWRIGACDPDGCDLVRGDDAVRLIFPARLSSPAQLQAMLAGLSQTSSK
jgi:putative heme iron utilization protein